MNDISRRFNDKLMKFHTPQIINTWTPMITNGQQIVSLTFALKNRFESLLLLSVEVFELTAIWQKFILT